MFYIWKGLFQVRNMTVVVHSFDVLSLDFAILLGTFRYELSLKFSIFVILLTTNSIRFKNSVDGTIYWRSFLEGFW